MRTIYMVMLLALVTPARSADGITLGYLTGNDYVKLSEEQRGAWAIGVLDGIMAEAALSSGASNGTWLGRCIGGLPSSQLQAMIDRYIQESPDSWHAPAALVARGKLFAFCKGRG